MSDQTEKKSASDFEASMEELEKLVESMEQDDLSLEDSLKNFEKGIQLTRLCQKALTDAEQEIKVLMGNKETGFEPNES